MQIRDIYYEKHFARLFQKLPKHIQIKAVKAEHRFRQNPFHPSLRLHKLQGRLEGLWSISITMNYRIIFRPLPNGDMLFISIGPHSIYER